MKHIWKSKRFLIGFTYLFVFISASFIYSLYFKEDTLNPMRLLYDENENLIAASPFEPHEMPPLGSDRFGISIFYQILDGAKFTILFAIGISFLRIFFSAIFGVLLSLYMEKLKKVWQSCTEVFYYVPTVFIAAILIFPVQLTVYSNQDAFIKPDLSLVFYQSAILIFVAIPTLTMYISSEVNEFMKREYILSAKIMGASRFHIIVKHIRALLSERLFLLFMQHIVQTLLLMIHLSLLNIVIGGVQMKEATDFGEPRPVSLSNDWAGLIGLNYHELHNSMWIVTSTLFAFFFTILMIKLMTAGIQDSLQAKESVKKERTKQQTYQQNEKESFTFAHTQNDKKRSSISI
ncbi:peptide ABC transporter permease [Bacillus manliponensis]|uniref:Peptide ABC transporter permease n=1 Tax=Bacillus manliponensis TaxID=574376 RepID=A0A073K0U8_9BACI|nr:ABC transporter permease subunit [Bacillus manliponensis]KEK20067.1 peptide ABC transporter permease [Bacillus manliponensis]